MAKTLEFEYEGKAYTLEFTRATVKKLGKDGFNLDEIGRDPLNTIEDLWCGAFLAHHRYIDRQKALDMLSHVGNRKELLGKLCEMYNEPIAALINENDDEDETKNVGWKANF